MGTLTMAASPPIKPSAWMRMPVLVIWQHMQSGAEERIKCVPFCYSKWLLRSMVIWQAKIPW
jgi:hypothetical protein